MIQDSQPLPLNSEQFAFDVALSTEIKSNGTYSEKAPAPDGPLSAETLDKMNRYWQAANYLTVGQIYLRENPLLREPLTAEHIKPRLLGHWGTSTGQNFLYVHLNRLIKEQDANIIFISGPGHGGPALNANSYLEGSYTEIRPEITPDIHGLRLFFRQFSTPGGVPSHCWPHVPNSMHEGGELGYSLLHAFGAAFDNPDLLVACVIGDGEAETCPMEGSWKGINFLNPVRDGAVLPILHLNGYKISGPTVLGRTSDDDLRSLFKGHGYQPYFVEGDDPMSVHQLLAQTLDTCYAEIRAIQKDARWNGFTKRPVWPLIIMRTPKGWTGPKVVDGVPIEGTFRAHQAPLATVRENPEHLQILQDWMKSYHPENLFDADGKLIPELAELAPQGNRRMGGNPHVNGGRILTALELPDFTDYALDIPGPGQVVAEAPRKLGEFLRDIIKRNPMNFRLFCPDETNSNRLNAVFEATKRCSMSETISIDDQVGPDGRGVNVVDLSVLMMPDEHPHGMDNGSFDALFTSDAPVIFAFHNNRWTIHTMVHGRSNESRFHVRGYMDRGTTTTPFDMVVLNKMSRYHLAIDALKQVSRLRSDVSDVIDMFTRKLSEHYDYIRKNLEDMPEIRDWSWTDDFSETGVPPPLAKDHPRGQVFTDG